MAGLPSLRSGTRAPLQRMTPSEQSPTLSLAAPHRTLLEHCIAVDGAIRWQHCSRGCGECPAVLLMPPSGGSTALGTAVGALQAEAGRQPVGEGT